MSSDVHAYVNLMCLNSLLNWAIIAPFLLEEGINISGSSYLLTCPRVAQRGFRPFGLINYFMNKSNLLTLAVSCKERNFL